MWEQYEIAPADAVTGTPLFTTPTEEALIARVRTDLRWWFDFRGRLIETSPAKRFVEMRSRAAMNGIQQPKLVAPSEALGIYYGLSPIGPAVEEGRFGIDANNAVLSGSNNRSMDGVGQSVQIPTTGDFAIVMRLRMAPPSSNSILMASKDPTTNWALSVTSTFSVRAYADFPGTTVSSTTAIDTNPRTLLWNFSRSSNTVEMYSDLSLIRAPTAFVMPAYPDYNLYWGHAFDGASQSFSAGWAVHSAACIASLNGVTLGLFRNVMAERGIT